MVERMVGGWVEDSTSVSQVIEIVDCDEIR